jgi:hypothetical protein
VHGQDVDGQLWDAPGEDALGIGVLAEDQLAFEPALPVDAAVSPDLAAREDLDGRLAGVVRQRGALRIRVGCAEPVSGRGVGLGFRRGLVLGRFGLEGEAREQVVQVEGPDRYVHRGSFG